jgi:hypothetical protein
MAGEGDIRQAVALLAFAQMVEASEWETKERAQKALAELEECLPAEAFHAAQGKGHAIDLAEAVSTALGWLSPG